VGSVSPLTAVPNFITPAATGVRPVQTLSRHFGYAVVPGVLGLTEPTRLSSSDFSRQSAEVFLSSFCTTPDGIRRTTAQLPLFLQQGDNSLKGWWGLLIPFG